MIIDTEWRLLKYYDPSSENPSSIENDRCETSISIKFEKRNKLVTTLENKWSFLGSYKLTPSDTIRISTGINHKLYLDRDECASQLPTFALHRIIGGIKRYRLRGDTLLLTFTIKANKEAKLIFLRNRK